MKTLHTLLFFIFVIFLFVVSFISGNARNEMPDNFDWLLGKWELTNEEEGKNTFEYWEKGSNGNYSGIGFTLRGTDTVKQ